MAAHVRRREQSALRHRFERLQRRHELGQPHGQARIDEHVDQIIVTVHFGMGNAAREANLVSEREPRGNPLEIGLLIAAANEEHAHARLDRQDLRQCCKQQR